LWVIDEEDDRAAATVINRRIDKTITIDDTHTSAR
jgi:hypothetical protein